MPFTNSAINEVYDNADCEIVSGISEDHFEIILDMAKDAASKLDDFAYRYPHYCVNSELLVIEHVQEILLRNVFEDLCILYKKYYEGFLKIYRKWLNAPSQEKGEVIVFDDYAYDLFSNMFDYWLDLQSEYYWECLDDDERLQFDQDNPDVMVKFG